MDFHIQEIIKHLQQLNSDLQESNQQNQNKVNYLNQKNMNLEKQVAFLNNELGKTERELEKTEKMLNDTINLLQMHEKDIVYLDEQTRWKDGRPKVIPESEYQKILYYSKQGRSLREIAEYYNVSHSTIRRILQFCYQQMQQ